MSVRQVIGELSIGLLAASNKNESLLWDIGSKNLSSTAYYKNVQWNLRDNISTNYDNKSSRNRKHGDSFNVTAQLVLQNDIKSSLVSAAHPNRTSTRGNSFNSSAKFHLLRKFQGNGTRWQNYRRRTTRVLSTMTTVEAEHRLLENNDVGQRGRGSWRALAQHHAGQVRITRAYIDLHTLAIRSQHTASI